MSLLLGTLIALWSESDASSAGERMSAAMAFSKFSL
jgi:hypothetical protein